ncbi:ATP-dependent Clp protease ATP-binding subunit [Apilactobacillus xinyiensis]|uniref:ATP-dependent Clp protease ATP-binding subunit n=1 Tax=Apilactobacillus xinyiensis TaxID=2841032 RepID=UPI00200C3D1F|nr:ATP-dependent Clp protease ATP-binding subunit [Apilactobacillus xinyiensis]MCL0329724.1 AAA family ATPase [Apilactobacillus xinyiensis]
MLCQNCNKNEASIHLFINNNGKRQQINLCQECYLELSKNQGFQNNLEGADLSDGNLGSLNDILNSMKNNNDAADNQNTNRQPKSKNKKSLLKKFGVNMTELAKNNEIDPVIGRDKEINKVIEILNRRTKNNPVLIGEAGVGKTAVVEGLALQIAKHKVPSKLINKKVFRLDMVSLVQGTGFRGQFEQRINQLIQEVKNDPNIILFIDEIHEIMGAGNAEGGMDAGNILKPALARGEFQLIGSTTLKEYRDIEKDSALARRFQKVMVKEPSIQKTVDILKGIQSKYEEYHHVKYTDKAIEAAVRLSKRYIQDRYLPDKAIDLLDTAGSKANLSINFTDPETLKKKIDNYENEKQNALKNEDYEKAAYYRDEIKAIKDTDIDNQNTNVPSIKVSDIEKIIENDTGIPVGKLQQQEKTKLRDLAEKLNKNVIGQSNAVNKVSKAIKRNRIGFNGTGRPIGSFLFVGTTGIGKTELAKQLAKELFGSKEAMIRFDMSEYREQHSISKLIGSPPGYVGYDEAGQLTEKVRRNPYSLILFDEVEKAHPDVLHAFLQILDDGRLTDSQGRVVSFKDTVIIMTSNAGSDIKETSVGFGAERTNSTNSVINKLTNYFKPEFINRFDDIVEFNQLSKDNLKTIVDIMINNLNKMLSTQHISIELSDNAKNRIVELGYNPKMGARPLRRVIQEQIEDKVADYYLDKNEQVSNIFVDLDNESNITISNK